MQTTMSSSLILFTGATGFVGFHTLIEALSKGYSVRAAVRSEDKITSITTAKTIQPFLSQLSFVIVPDITKDGAFDEAVKGVQYIVHLASPLPKAGISTDWEQSLVLPAIQGTLSILYSALKQPTIKRVVITSSVVAVFPEDWYTTPMAQVFNANTIRPDTKGPYQDAAIAYSASKKLALNRTLDFIAKETPHFTIINLMPTFVLGADTHAETPSDAAGGSNGQLLRRFVQGTDVDALPAMTVHLDDVVFVHIAALTQELDGHQNFGLNFNGPSGIVWDDAIDIVKDKFPDSIANGILHTTGAQPSVKVPFDASETEKVFGFRYKPFEQQVQDAVGRYVELASKA